MGAPPAGRRGGRPKKADTDRRSVAMTVWMTPAEAGLIRRAAAERGESLSAYLVAGGRRRAGAQPVERFAGSRAAELRRALWPIGNNINQLTRAVNVAIGRPDDVAGRVAAELAAGRQTIADLGRHVAELLAGDRRR